jgi:hypothetical protein
MKQLTKWTVGILYICIVLGLTVGVCYGQESDWGFGAGLVPPGISIDFDGTEKISTGFNVASGGASVSVFKGEGFKYIEFGADSYFRFEEGEASNVGFGGHFSGLEKNGWSLIGLPNIYERE